MKRNSEFRDESQQASLLTTIVGQFVRNSTKIRAITRCRGGFSGSKTWEVKLPQGSYCLRQWSPSVTAERILWIHREIGSRKAEGMDILPEYLMANSHQTIAEEMGSFWELATWLPGKPVELPPEDHHGQAMFGALARLHAQGETKNKLSGNLTTSPGIESRLDVLGRWRGIDDSRFTQLTEGHLRHLRPLAEQLWAGFRRFELPLRGALEWGTTVRLPIVTCIGDPRPEHFLFEADRLTGLIDFGSLRQDFLALDLARLAGELYGNNLAQWELAEAWYGSDNQAMAPQWEVAWVFDAANALLSGLNWIDWLWVQRRRFDDLAEVEKRLRALVSRIDKLPGHPAFSIGKRASHA
ncbi:MAG: aminoglycoside phosphotransferase family protein [Pirellulaceae bacterium]